MSETQLMSYALREHMELSSVDKLIPVAEVGMKRLPLTKHYRVLLRDAFLKIAEYHKTEKHYYEYVKSFRKVLHFAPGNETAIYDQLEGLNTLLSSYGQKYIKKDLEYLEFVIQLLRLKYSKGKYSKKIQTETQRLLDQIQALEIKASGGEESKHTFQIKQLIEPFTLGLTKDQIDGIADALSPFIPDLIKELERLESEKKK